jgi:hypothetical protein
MKPLKILLFLVAVFGLLLMIALSFPKDGISLGKEFHLQFMSTANIFHKDTVSTAYTDSLIINTSVTDDPEFDDVDSVFLLSDSLVEMTIDVNMDSIINARIDSISKTVFPLEFSDAGRTDLYAFFRNAKQAEANGKLVRVLHYGDSQIENDRMTSLLRFRFQKVFGGSGCGIVPAIPLYFGNPTFKEEFVGDWVRYTGFGKRDSTLEHNCYGLLGCFTSVPEPVEDELPALRFKFHKGRRASKFSSLSLYMHSFADNGFIALHMNDTISDTLSIINKGYQKISYEADFKVEKLKIEFKLPSGGRLYGSSGLEFSRSDLQTMDSMIDDIDPGLIIMQFGGNVVPYIKNTAYYKKVFKREIAYMKKLFPGIAILVIGPSDMSMKENGQFITYPKVEPVRNVLKESALESGCSFWDMYEAMGGENSIQNFVLADPPLASTDYIHFTFKGANMVAGMFFDAVMLEYNKYKASY